MSRPACLLDTGPLVALLLRNDRNHDKAKAWFAAVRAPLVTCEAVLSESCFLLARADPKAPAEVLALARKGLFDLSFGLDGRAREVESVMRKYADRRVSLADACLVACADAAGTGRVLTFDADFKIYRWGRNRRFEIGPGERAE